MLTEKRKVEKIYLKIRYQATVKEKEKEARISYKMKINPRQIFISSDKKNILCRKILTCEVFTALLMTSYESQKKKRKKIPLGQCRFDEQSPSQILQPQWKMLTEKRGIDFFFLKKIRYQAAMREKEKEARTSYKIVENASKEKGRLKNSHGHLT